MRTPMARPWFLLLAISIMASFLFVGCESDSDDDDEDIDDDDSDGYEYVDDVDGIELDGVFLDPLWNTDLDAQAIADKISRAREEVGADTVILPWTVLHDRALYPSSSFEMEPGIASEDMVLAVLDAARDNGLRAVIGLSAARNASEMNLDPVNAELARQGTIIQELLLGYGDHPAFQGFYLNYEILTEPTSFWMSLLMDVAGVCRTFAPDKEVWISVRYPGPPIVQVVDEIFDNPDDLDFDDIDDPGFRAYWALTWIQAALAAELDVLLIADKTGSRQNSLDEALKDYDAVRRARQDLGADVTIAGRVDLFAGSDGQGMQRYPARADEAGVLEGAQQAQRFTDGCYGYFWDVFDEEAALPDRSEAADQELEQKALWMDEHLRSRFLRDGQIVTVNDGTWPVDAFKNWWQEDACWLTGIYCSAESFRYAVTKDPEAREYARQAFQTLHNMAHATPLDGEVVRNYSTYFFGQLTPVDPDGDTIKRWHKHPDKEMYWVGDISIDQLSGYLPGMATYYDLVADDAEREIIRRDIMQITDLFLANELFAVQFDGQRTTYGNLRASPSLALDFLQIAYHITGDYRYRWKFLEIYENESMDMATLLVYYALHNITRKYAGQHFLDSGFYHLLMYESDPEIYSSLSQVFQYVYTGSHTFGNAHANHTHQAHNADSNGALAALNELQRTDPRMLDNGYWYATVNEDYSAGHVYIPIERRPAKEYYWSYAPDWYATPRETPCHMYAGAEWLMVYWGGRYHGWIR